MLALAMLLAECAVADTITFAGTGIALRGCRIQAIQGGQISYTDPNNQRQRRPLEQVEAIGFDGLPQLDQAETALADGDLDAGVWALLRGLLAAENDLQRLWLHARLAAVHDLRGEYVQAAAHAADVFGLSDDVSWKSLRPVSPVNAPSFAAAAEALDRLQNAARTVKSAELKQQLEAMIRVVQGVHSSLMAERPSQTYVPGTTVSGYLKSDVRDRDSPPAPGEQTAPATPAVPDVAATAPARSPAALPAVAPRVEEDASDPRSAAAIDRLLAAGKHAEALALCGEIEKDPGQRDLARFLYQYGRALSLAGRPSEAAIMFTRCAVLFPESDDAGAAMIETAVIYRDHYRRPATARRLLSQVIADAERSERAATLKHAKEVLATLPAE